MNLGFLTGNFNISSKKFLAILFLYLSTFSWFFFFYGNYKFSSSADFGYQLLGFMDTSYVLTIAVFFSFIVAFAIIGSLIGERYDRRKLFLSWTILGVFSSALAGVFQGTTISLLSSALVGMSFGLCFPLVTAYMSDSTAVEERARVSGIVVFTSFLVAIIGTALVSSTSLGAILFSIILRFLGFFALILDPCSRNSGKKHSWQSILTYRQFGFYILPFLMFIIMSGLLGLIQIPKNQTQDYGSANLIGNVLHLVGTGIFAIIGGFAADRIGRRKPIMIGVVMLGVSTAILGYMSPLTWLVYLAISGFAWGIVFVTYLAIPGDLAFPGSQERFYALGTVVPFIVYTSITGAGKAVNISLPITWLYPVLTVVIFVSLIPLLYASETLPEKILIEKKLKEHLKKVHKVIEESKNAN